MNSIGLPTTQTKEIVKGLNNLLASYSVLYMNTRGFHWNIKGKEFFELHLKFEEIYNTLVLQIDEIAERILTLEGTPLHSFTDNLKHSAIKEMTHITDGKIALENILESYTTILNQERSILKLAGDIDDEGTAAQMSDYIKLQEKEVWMFRSYLA
ncbi:MAG: DNA starvation/stationary phase protection protein [Bacteroidia bacterium]|nr:DNA starvation/stationary phase protection protein [Bacteroidia bacterium]NNJ54532.1 DNA starvation/stationary phase protection protein [Bacteroidia bacterium]